MLLLTYLLWSNIHFWFPEEHYFYYMFSLQLTLEALRGPWQCQKVNFIPDKWKKSSSKVFKWKWGLSFHFILATEQCFWKDACNRSNISTLLCILINHIIFSWTDSVEQNNRSYSKLGVMVSSFIKMYKKREWRIRGTSFHSTERKDRKYIYLSIWGLAS